MISNKRINLRITAINGIGALARIIHNPLRKRGTERRISFSPSLTQRVTINSLLFDQLT